MVKVRGCLSRDGTHRLLVAADPYVVNDCKRMQDRNENHNFSTEPVVCGDSGSGKSTFCIQTLAPLLARDVKDIYVTWSTDEAIKIGTDPKTKELSVIIVDESERDLGSGQHASKAFRRWRNFLSECRAMRFYIILILPSFFILNSTFALFRTNVLYFLETHNNRRGYIQCYGRDSKLLLFIKGRKYFDMKAHPSDYNGSFALNKNILDEVCPNYLEKKAKHFREFNTLEKGPAATARGAYEDSILDKVVLGLKIMDKKEWTHKKIAEFCGVSEHTIKNAYQRIKLSGELPPNLVDYSNWYNKYKQKQKKQVDIPLQGAKSQGLRVANTINTGENKKTDDGTEGEGEKIDFAPLTTNKPIKIEQDAS